MNFYVNHIIVNKRRSDPFLTMLKFESTEGPIWINRGHPVLPSTVPFTAVYKKTSQTILTILMKQGYKFFKGCHTVHTWSSHYRRNTFLGPLNSPFCPSPIFLQSQNAKITNDKISGLWQVLPNSSSCWGDGWELLATAWKCPCWWGILKPEARPRMSVQRDEQKLDFGDCQ